jgi:hypothetical protein
MGWRTHTSPHLLTLPHPPTRCLHITLSPPPPTNYSHPFLHSYPSPYLSTLSTPLSLILPYLAIFQSMAGADTHHTPLPFPLTFLTPAPATYISPPSLSSSTFLPFPPNYSQSLSGSWTLTTLTPLFTSLPNLPTRSRRLQTHLLNFRHLHISPSPHLTSHIPSHT